MLGMMVCYDLAFPEVARAYALQGAEVVFCPTGSSFPDDDVFFTCLKARAIENSIYVVGVNRFGAMYSPQYRNSDIYSSGWYTNFGRSVIFGPNGQVLAQSNAIAEEVITVPVDLAKVYAMRQPGGDGPMNHAPILDRNKKAYQLTFNSTKPGATNIA